MNRDCNGDFLTILGKRNYRCLMDSTLLAADDIEDGTECPHCRRKISATDHGTVRTKTYRLVEYLHPDFGWEVYSKIDASPVSEEVNHG